MQFRTFLKTGVEVLHLGGQDWESNAWPKEHWREHKGRWRLFTPAIDEFLNEDLAQRAFGVSVDTFVLLLEVADFKAWGKGIAFTGPEGFTRYKHKTNELWSVGRIDWTVIQDMTVRQQLQAFELALTFAVDKASQAKRRPKDFDLEAFRDAVVNRLRLAKIPLLSRAAYAARSEA
jgi:hypothetical protein